MIEECLTKIEDFRGGQGRFYTLKSLFYPLLYGIGLGLTSIASIHRYLKERLTPHQRKKLGVQERFPSVRTLRRAANALNISFLLTKPAASDKSVAPVRCAEPITKRSILHLDGKTLKSGDKNETGKAPHILNLYNGKTRVLVGQALCKKGPGGERAAASRLLTETDVSGAIITGDAGFSSGETPQDIFNAGADYFLRVKDNQPTIMETMRLRLEQARRFQLVSRVKTTFSGHKIEERQARILPTAGLHVLLSKTFKGAAYFGVVEKRVTDKRTGEVTRTSHYFITSLQEGTADEFLDLHIAHWRIENDLHKVKDVYLQEDNRRCGSGKKAFNLSALASLAVSKMYKICASPAEAFDKIRAKPPYFFNQCTAL